MKSRWDPTYFKDGVKRKYEFTCLTLSYVGGGKDGGTSEVIGDIS